MTVLSKPTKIGIAVAGILTWAVWYDHKRRSHPDYKKNLVEKRKNELIDERKKSDPSYYVDKIPLCENLANQSSVQQYTMARIAEGEEYLEKQDYSQGAAYIACGLAYMPEQMYLATLQQLAQGLPPQVVKLIRECGIVARARARKQQMELMFKKQEQARGDAKIQEVTEAEADKKEESKPIEEPEDVDSIDGDTEEAPAEEESKDEPKIQELEEDDIDEDEENVVKAEPEKEEEAEQPEILTGSQQSSIEIVKPEEIEAAKEEMKQVEVPVEENNSHSSNEFHSTKAESVKAESEKAESEKAESEKAESVKDDSENIDQVEPVNAESEKEESVKAESVKAESEKAESDKAESEKADSEKAESVKDDLENVELAESEKAESEKAESIKADSDNEEETTKPEQEENVNTVQIESSDKDLADDDLE